MNTEVLVGCIHCKMAWIVSLEYLRREHTSSGLPGAIPVTNGGKPENIKDKKKSKQQRKNERKEKNNAAKAKAKAMAKEDAYELPGAVPVTNGGKPENIKEEKKSKQQRKKERKEKNNAAKAKAKAKAKEAQPTRSQPAQATCPTGVYQRMGNGRIIHELNFYGWTTVLPQTRPRPTRAYPYSRQWFAKFSSTILSQGFI
uniref:Uncharacterized protein n=1 Tax=Fagus sylvatica TaxID=28930 RepID=A0A2N9HF75_FAGSY